MMNCECEFALGSDKGALAWGINWCPLHAAAGEMLAELKAIEFEGEPQWDKEEKALVCSCPSCGGMSPKHQADCNLARLIAEAESGP